MKTMILVELSMDGDIDFYTEDRDYSGDAWPGWDYGSDGVSRILCASMDDAKKAAKREVMSHMANLSNSLDIIRSK